MTSEHDPDRVPLDPEEARQHPENAVDALERGILGDHGERLDGRDPDGGRGEGDDPSNRSSDGPLDAEDRTTSAFEIDLDPGDQGSADAAVGDPG